MTDTTFLTNSALTALDPIVRDVSSQAFPRSTLYVVATPIGNAGDISLRALHLLSIADTVACEDTRNTAHLLARYGISKPLIAAHQHNERAVSEKLVARLQAGERIALLSDAGTPTVSDPGARIVDAVLREGLRIMPLPGPSAALCALAAGGLMSGHFYFAGFLPRAARQRDEALSKLCNLDATLVLYEAPHRIEPTVAALMQVFEPTRQIVLARELTKLFEQIHRCHLSDAAPWLAAEPGRRKGEFVILVDSAPKPADEVDGEAQRVLALLLSACPLKQAVALAAQITGQKKNTLYQKALQMQRT